MRIGTQHVIILSLLFKICCFPLIHPLHHLLSLIQGNEALFSLETASDYVKDEKACFYGFKCVAVGYEFNPGLDEVCNFFLRNNKSVHEIKK